jgi:excisionase family DNA binding protein
MEENLESWISKEEAVARTGLDKRTIERKAKAGEIRQMDRPVPGRKPLPVYHPEDIEKLCTRTLKPTVLATPTRQKAATSEPVFIVPLHMKIFLTLPEAVAYSGLPKTYLEKKLKDNTIPAFKAGGWRIKRIDLETYCGTPRSLPLLPLYPSLPTTLGENGETMLDS